MGQDEDVNPNPSQYVIPSSHPWDIGALAVAVCMGYEIAAGPERPDPCSLWLCAVSS